MLSEGKWTRTRSILPENVAIYELVPSDRDPCSVVCLWHPGESPPTRMTAATTSDVHLALLPGHVEHRSALLLQPWGQSWPGLWQRTPTAASAWRSAAKEFQREGRESRVQGRSWGVCVCMGGGGVGIPGLCEYRVNDITSHQLPFEKTTVVKNSTAF